MSKIALLPGGFKPPHAGHYNMAKWLVANTDADTVLVRVGSKERDGITREISLALWDLYTQDDDNIIVKASEQNSPVRDVYDYIEQEAPKNSTVYLGMGEKDINDQRFNNIGKFAEPKNIEFETVLVPPQAGGVSGTEMRNFINNNDKESFQKYLPDHINKDKAWDIVTGNLEEDFYDPRNKTVDFMRSSEYKAGMPDGPKPDIKFKGDNKGNIQRAPVSWEENLIFETRGGEREFHIYDFDETIARAETPIPYEIKSPEGEVIESGETTSVEFENKREELENEYDEGVVIDYNFDAFRKLIGDATINNPVFQKLLDSIKNPNAKVTILTARSVGYPVTKFLKDQGIWAYVKALGEDIDGAVTGQDKANWIDKRIKDTTKKVIFIDDSDDNKEAVSMLSQAYPNIEFDIQDPPPIEEMIGTMNNQEKAKHAKNLKRLKKYTSKQGDQYVPVPDFIKGTLTRKLYENKYYIDNSNIQGIGAFADNNYPTGTIIGKLHDMPNNINSNYNFYELGKSYNHSDTPNCENLLHNNTRYLVTIQPIQKGEELTADYRLQPDLEQPEHFEENIDPKSQAKHKGKAAPYGSAYKPVKEGDTYEKMAAKGKKRGNLKQGTVRKRLKIKAGDKIPLSKINKAISRIKKMKNPSEKNKKYLKALNLAKTLKTTTHKENINEADPKKGTGKKPKGSGRRLYTDENPKDTVKVKFSTRQDIVDTLSKKSFKSKPHKRQSQIINLIHQRVRAALSRTKDPQKKKRLKSAFEYIKKRKEASKRKTQRMKKESILTKSWWKKIITEKLLVEGGAAGHMNHPFDDRALTFEQMKELVRLSLQGNLDIEEAVTEKTDGQNLAVTYKNGKVGAARNKATIREPMDIDAVAAKFEGRGEIEKAFTHSMRDLENALKELDENTLNDVFQNGTRFLNIEIIYPETKNVITYGSQAYLQFHGLDEFNLESATKVESYGVPDSLKNLTQDVNARTQDTFEIIPPKIVQTQEVPDFDEKESYYIEQINKLQQEFDLSDDDPVLTYHEKWWEQTIDELFPETTEEEKEALVRRWASFKKDFPLRKITDKETSAKVIEYDKQDFKQTNKQNVYQFEKIFLELGVEVLANIDGFLAANPDESVQELRKDIQKVQKQVEESGDLEVLKKLEYQLKRIEDIGGFDKLVPSEGIVFIYQGKTYKLTGLFAPVNQLLGLTKYV